MPGHVIRPSEDPAAAAGWAGTDLEDLDAAARTRLAEHARVRDFEAQTEILREGRPTPFLGLIEFGRVALRVPVPARGPRTVVTLEPGDLIGWSAIVPPYRATAEAIALTETRVRAFEAAALRDLLAVDPGTAAQVYAVVLRCVSERLTTSWHQLLDLFGMRGVGPW